MSKLKNANLIGIILIVFLLGLTIVLVQPPQAAVSSVPIDKKAEVDIYCNCRCDLKDVVANRVWCCMNCEAGCSLADVLACVEKAENWEICDSH